MADLPTILATVFAGIGAFAAAISVFLQVQEQKLTRAELAKQAEAQDELATATHALVGAQREANTVQLLLARATAEALTAKGAEQAGAVLTELRKRTKDYVHG